MTSSTSFLRVLALAAAPVLMGWSAEAAPPSLGIPVECRIGEECFIQNYVDNDRSPDRHDFTCGRLTYDGHTGTDFRVADLAAMRRGVPVVAAADGVVVDTRDGMEDVSVRVIGVEALKGRDAGNRVAIDHGDGWLTQYSHLRKGSVAVKRGDQVKAGQRIGEIGLSGKTEFPHVDFLINRRGAIADPFVGPDPAPACGVATAPLWSAEALRQLAYRPSGVIGAGFVAETPKEDKARDGDYARSILPRDASVLAFWAEIFGGQAGDAMSIRIEDPQGRTVKQAGGTVPRPLAVLFVADQAPRPPGGWTPGTYRARFTLTRNGAVAAEAVRQVEIR